MEFSYCKHGVESGNKIPEDKGIKLDFIKCHTHINSEVIRTYFKSLLHLFF